MTQRASIVIIDFGSQYTQLIARRVRELGVFSEILSPEVTQAEFENLHPCGVILSGGPDSVNDEGSPRIPEYILASSLPILGICYGMQALIVQQGGRIKNATHHREFGFAEIEIQKDHAFFKNLNSPLTVWMSHGDSVVDYPDTFSVLASTPTCPVVAIAHRTKPWVGLQFHPEVTHTPEGMQMLAHFVKNMCACTGEWNTLSIKEAAIADIRYKVGSERVILALSGGVDSSVLAVLLHEAIGPQLQCVFVDTGLLRLNEGDEIMQVMHDHLKVPILRVNAQERFLNALQGVTDPEMKRKAIGRIFIEIFQETAQQFADAHWLAQGTIYSDVVESAKTKHGKAHVIKSHHNVGGLPDTLHLKLLEPLRDLFKDEVRQLGLALGLPRERIYAHPFPGPGLGVRILGEVTEERLAILRQVDAIFISALRKSGWYEKTAQAFAVYIPQKSVAVMGDARVYADVIALRAVESIDYMTATWAPLPHALLAEISTDIMNSVRGISRVVYDITGKPPATIEWE